MREDSVGRQSSDMATGDISERADKDSLPTINTTPTPDDDLVPDTPCDIPQSQEVLSLDNASVNASEKVQEEASLPIYHASPLPELSPSSTAPVPTQNSSSLQAQISTARPYDVAAEKELIAEIKGKRYLCYITSTTSMGLLIGGTAAVFLFAFWGVSKGFSLDVIGSFAKSLIGILTDIGGVILFKYYQSMQKELSNMWQRLHYMRGYSQAIMDSNMFISQMTDLTKKDDLIIDVVKRLLNDQKNP